MFTITPLQNHGVIPDILYFINNSIVVDADLLITGY